MSDHLAVKVVGVYEDCFEVRDGRWTTDLAEDVGEFMLEECRWIREAWRRYAV
jgi:hypothetical protein